MFAPAEPVALAAGASDPTVAFEPVGDRPVIAWLETGAAGPDVQYATRTEETLP